MDRLKRLVDECDRRGFVVDVTLERGKEFRNGHSTGRLPNFMAHQRAVTVLVTVLKPHRNWYLDLSNERDIRDDRYVPLSELQDLRALVRGLDRSRLATASFGGHDLTARDVRDALLTVGVGIAGSPSTRECVASSIASWAGQP